MKVSYPQTAVLFPEFGTEPENPWAVGLTNDQASGTSGLTALELCAGAGGQAIGLEQAGIEHAALVEIDKHACSTVRLNRPTWNVIEQDLNTFDGSAYKGVDLLSGGLPCPPFSVAGKLLGKEDERNLFPIMIRLVDQVRPRAVMIENVKGFLKPVFEEYRTYVRNELVKLGYETGWKLMNASDFGVPQLRPRVVFIAVLRETSEHFSWPQSVGAPPPAVGETLVDLMSANGWSGAGAWARRASGIAPTVVGGSKKHGGPDLGPTRARRAWAALGVDGLGVANQAPGPEFPISGIPRLTVRMVARLQGFSDHWQFAGGKTQSYRQVGNAFPPPFARSVAERIRACLTAPKSFRIAG